MEVLHSEEGGHKKGTERTDCALDYQSAYGIKKGDEKTVTYPLSESHVDF